MTTRKKKIRSYLFSLVGLIFILLFGILLPNIPLTEAIGNQTVRTKLNITNTEPFVYNVTVNQNVALNPGTTATIFCNASVYDRESALGNSMRVNATFYFSTYDPLGPLKNDSKYIINCTNITTLVNPSRVVYSCNLTVWYFADNGTWNCNVSAIDNGNLNSSSYNITTILPLIAINITTTLVDYGNMSALNISDEKLINVSNFGNIPMNLTVRGWGGYNESAGTNFSMLCDVGNITIDQERFNITSGSNWVGMTNLTGSPINTTINGLTVLPRNDTMLSLNSTYWKIRVPTGVAGVCNGTIMFTAING